MHPMAQKYILYSKRPNKPNIGLKDCAALKNYLNNFNLKIEAKETLVLKLSTADMST
jgi:hypothetical protein